MTNSKNTVKPPTPQRQPNQVDVAPAAYAQLADFNEICVSAAERLEEFEEASMLPEVERAYYAAMLWELRAAVSQSVADHMSSSVRKNDASSWNDTLIRRLVEVRWPD